MLPQHPTQPRTPELRALAGASDDRPSTSGYTTLHWSVDRPPSWLVLRGSIESWAPKSLFKVDLPTLRRQRRASGEFEMNLETKHAASPLAIRPIFKAIHWSIFFCRPPELPRIWFEHVLLVADRIQTRLAASADILGCGSGLVPPMNPKKSAHLNEGEASSTPLQMASNDADSSIARVSK